MFIHYRKIIRIIKVKDTGNSKSKNILPVLILYLNTYLLSLSFLFILLLPHLGKNKASSFNLLPHFIQ